MTEEWRGLRFAPKPGTLLCEVTDVPDGGGREFVFGGGKEPFRLVVFRRGDVAYAYVNRCPHFGIPLNAGPMFLTRQSRVICVSHYARFRFSDGYCEDGPCLGASLEAVPLSVESDVLRVG